MPGMPRVRLLEVNCGLAICIPRGGKEGWKGWK